MTTAAPEYATWDLTPYFDALDGESYREFFAGQEQRIKTLQERAAQAGTLSEHNLDAWAALLGEVEDVVRRSSHLSSYLGCLSAADSRNEDIQRETASRARLGAEQEKIFVRLVSGLKDVPDTVFDRLLDHPDLQGAAHILRRMRERARLTMATDLELLTSELSVTGINAWGRLYDQVSGRLQFTLELPDGSSRQVPMSQKNSLIEDADPAVRKATLVGSNAAWSGVEDVVASALNAISGTRLTLDRWRGIPHFLDVALIEASITRKTLETMMDVIASKKAVPQEYLRLKARLQGKSQLGFQDLSAPLPLPDPDKISWPEARKRVLDAFGSFYPSLRDFAAEAFNRRWIDSEPRSGKRPGGFCSSSLLINESRIFMTFNSTLGDVSTLAHELGHAFHNRTMQDMRPFAHGYPMTLAETASTFGETLLSDATLEDPNSSARERAVILDARMEQAATYLLNIPMRFTFEKALYEERAGGELSPTRLKELMREAQANWFGDTVSADEMDLYFWASKLHFYITSVRFYNFPYAFGYLFSLGIFARFKQQGTDFLKQYESLLRLTGSDTAENVARQALGVDLEAPDFWLDSIRLIEADLERFKIEVPPVLSELGRCSPQYP